DAPLPHAPTPAEAATESIGALFRRYEGQGAEPAPTAASGSGQNVRAMLRHLSDLGARGEI
ncbi:hypothetical protein MTR62_19530, partial [Novosphingobium sp. 1949]|nr:hypothetical protein [Novosphingobium organovorum]